MIDPFFIIPRIGRLAYLNNPKAACSSLLLALSQMRLGLNFQPPRVLLPDGSHPIHGFHPEHAHFEYFFRRWPLNYPPLHSSLVKFSFVRNPYARFYSFYKSKVLVGQAPGDYYKKFGLEKGCSFAECVRIITSRDPRELEHHAAPQSMLLCDENGLHVDFVGKVESFSEDWQVIINLVGYDVVLDHLNKMDNRSGPDYSAEDRELIFNYYHDDFMLFGYEKDSVPVTDYPGEDSGGMVYGKHYLSSEQIESLLREIDRKNENIRQLSSEFVHNPAKREEFFGNQGELFRELMLKAAAVVETKADENRKSQTSLEKSVSSASRKIEGILRFNDRCKEKFSEIQENINEKLLKERTVAQGRIKDLQGRFNKEQEEFRKQLNKERDEIGRTRNLLYQQVLSTFWEARRSPWKRLRRRLLSPRIKEAKILRNAGLVDPHYYFENYPQAMKFGLTAVDHYVRLGAQTGYNPSAQFNTRQYLAEHPDVAQEGINPLVHYILRQKQN